MAGIADFLDSLIGGFDLICYSFLMGGLFWGVFVLRPWSNSNTYNPLLLDKTIGLIYQGGFLLAAAQIFKIVLKIWLMTAVLERWPFPEFADTTQFIGGIIRAALTLIVSAYVYFVLRKHAFSKQHWWLACVVSLPMVISGAWLVHAAGRFDNRAFLMTFTVFHQLGAAAWVGGVLQLGNVWKLHKQQSIAIENWPQLLKVFSKFGMISVCFILLSGLPIALQYIDTLNALVGTGYGNLLMVKVVLLSLALGCAWLNRTAMLAYFANKQTSALFKRVPHYVEAETLVLITLLFTAASLASQPPAIDIPLLTASWQEVLNTFNPQIPQTTSPSHVALIAGEAGRVAIINQVPSLAATEWSNYNHNIAGLFLTPVSTHFCVATL